MQLVPWRLERIRQAAGKMPVSEGVRCTEAEDLFCRVPSMLQEFLPRKDCCFQVCCDEIWVHAEMVFNTFHVALSACRAQCMSRSVHVTLSACRAQCMSRSTASWLLFVKFVSAPANEFSRACGLMFLLHLAGARLAAPQAHPCARTGVRVTTVFKLFIKRVVHNYD
jgi:hypothetical protein